MGVEKNNVVRELKRDIKVDGMLSQGEKTAMKEALSKDKNAVIEATKNELKDFILRDYAQRSVELVGIKGIKVFQQKVGINPDGVYGPDTFQQIAEYQKKYGLKVDGIIGQETLVSLTSKSGNTNKPSEEKKSFFGKLLSKKPEAEAPSIEENTSQLSSSQLREIMGYRGLKGKEGKALIRAIKEFQKVLGVTVTGKIDKDLFENIRIAKKLPYGTPMSGKDLGVANASIKRSEKFDGIERLRGRWNTIYKEFFQQLSEKEQNEVIGGKPFALVDSISKKLLFIYGKESLNIDVILGQNGITSGKYIELDKKTPVGMVHKFEVVKSGSNVPKSWLRKGQPYYPDLLPADNSTRSDLTFNSKIRAYEGFKGGKKVRHRVTVTGFSIQSPQAARYGGRYFHGVGPSRNKTWGCVGIEHKDYAKGMKMAQIIAAKGGFGYVSKI